MNLPLGRASRQPTRGSRNRTVSSHSQQANPQGQALQRRREQLELQLIARGCLHPEQLADSLLQQRGQR